MRTIRQNVFETNSSSIHCVTLMTDAEYKEFDGNNGLFNFFISKPATWDDYYDHFKRNCKYAGVSADKVPSMEEFKKGVEKFNQYYYDPFDDRDTNGALWDTCRSSGIFMKDGVAEIEESEREINGQVFHAVSAYVPED